MPNRLFENFLLLLPPVTLYISLLPSVCIADVVRSDARLSLITEATSWMQKTIKTDAVNFEIVPPDHRVKIVTCSEKLLFDFPFNGKETIRAKCASPTWQFFLQVKTDHPETKQLLSPFKQTKKRKNTSNSMEEVLVARKNLTVGSILQKNDTEIKKLKKNSLPVDVYNSFEGLENYEISRAIKSGSVIRSINLKLAKLVKRGTKVQFKILAQGMLVTATVEALEDGHLGQQIELLNSASGKTVVGIVTGLNEVSGL